MGEGATQAAILIVGSGIIAILILIYAWLQDNRFPREITPYSQQSRYEINIHVEGDVVINTYNESPVFKREEEPTYRIQVERPERHLLTDAQTVDGVALPARKTYA